MPEHPDARGGIGQEDCGRFVEVQIRTVIRLDTVSRSCLNKCYGTTASNPKYQLNTVLWKNRDTIAPRARKGPNGRY